MASTLQRSAEFVETIISATVRSGSGRCAGVHRCRLHTGPIRRHIFISPVDTCSRVAMLFVWPREISSDPAPNSPARAEPWAAPFFPATDVLRSQFEGTQGARAGLLSLQQSWLYHGTVEAALEV
jgi:hypothetical protein